MGNSYSLDNNTGSNRASTNIETNGTYTAGNGDVNVKSLATNGRGSSSNSVSETGKAKYDTQENCISVNSSDDITTSCNKSSSSSSVTNDDDQEKEKKKKKPEMVGVLEVVSTIVFSS